MVNKGIFGEMINLIKFATIQKKNFRLKIISDGHLNTQKGRKSIINSKYEGNYKRHVSFE